MTKVRVVLADDHPMYRYGVAAVLAIADEVDLVGEAPDGEALIALVEAERPDVVLTDLAMPGLDGVSARAILAVADGQAVYGAPVARRIAELFGAGTSVARPASPFPALTPREREVLGLLAASTRPDRRCH